MKKQKVSLELFEEAVLPMLQVKHADIASLQSAIKAGYEIYEEEDGKQVTINYKVTGKSKSAAEPEDADDDDATGTKGAGGDDDKLAAMVAKVVAATIKAMPKPEVKAVEGAELKVLNDRAVPEGLRLYKNITSFAGTTEERKFKAYRFGAMLLGGVFGQKKYADWCEEKGLSLRRAPKTDEAPTITIGQKTAHGENANNLGSVLVPEQVENDIIDLRERYGVFRTEARMRPMVRDTLLIPRRTSGLTAYFTAENTAITESNKTWDNVELTAKKLAALARYSTEILEDAIISIADDLAQEIVYAFSLKEDQCGFIGDSTVTYGGIEGIVNALTRVWTSTSTTAAGSVIASGNTFVEVTDADLMTVMGNLPEYADDGTAAWYCSRVAAFQVFARLLRASGGTTPAQAAGALPVAYAGYPIKITQVMPRTDVNSQVVAFFGSVRKASEFGDRRQTTISISDQRYWDADQVGIRGTERFDANTHDVGDGTNAGPLVALRASAS